VSLKLVSIVVGLGTALLVACGGNVVFVEDGDDGIGSGAGGPGSGPGSGTASGKVTGCDLLCAQHADCLGGGDCQATCKQIYVPGCEAEADALATCLAGAFGPSCDVGFECVSEIEAYSSCAGGIEPPPPDPSCATSSCDAGGESCGCDGTCFGGDLSVGCQTVPDGGVECKCSYDGPDGHADAVCSQFSLDCSLETNCCQSALFGGGPRG
jgi:hypothetical protein